jgi:hypothetical protein
MNRAAMVALAAVLMTGCAAGTRGVAARSVVVEGWAPLGTLPRPEARRRALADAQRRAVEEVAGVEIAAVSTVDGAARVRERLSSVALGSVRRFAVLGEDAADGILRLRVRAEVELRRKEAAHRIGWIPGTGPSADVAQSPAREAFVAAWTTYGGESAVAGTGGDVKIRLAQTQERVDEPRVRPFVSVRVRLTASVIRGEGGGEVWAATRESAALGCDFRQARERAERQAAEAVARAAAEELPARLWLDTRVTQR